MTRLKSPNDAAQLERLQAPAMDDGRAWARDLAAGLRASGRRAAGGWPGTLSEARSRAEPLLGDVRFDAWTDAREALARVLYAEARRDWLAHRDTEAGEPSAPAREP